ncbi:response regulator transcription factor [Dactylosporangium sucinum]|uniref:Response regulator n=1 Tax=Dactylosporangium sucinum TaxID=1424081 RepID=A0A917T9C4_9ACTN|nr:response regulator transcription factor [Dactylosporangium sucinum]GGM15227.1 response regulator [Dactylosporangium sucinum]
MAVRCVIVDDSERFRASARRLLTTQGMAVVADAADSRQALRAIDEHDPDVVLVDVGLGAESGLDLAAQIAPRPVIVVSSLAPDDVEELVGRTGALGFVSKSQLSALTITSLLRRLPET